MYLCPPLSHTHFGLGLYIYWKCSLHAIHLLQCLSPRPSSTVSQLSVCTSSDNLFSIPRPYSNQNYFFLTRSWCQSLRPSLWHLPLCILFIQLITVLNNKVFSGHRTQKQSNWCWPGSLFWVANSHSVGRSCASCQRKRVINSPTQL